MFNPSLAKEIQLKLARTHKQLMKAGWQQGYEKTGPLWLFYSQ